MGGRPAHADFGSDEDMTEALCADPIESTPTSPEHFAGKYMMFRLGDETYGLGILNIQEIIGMMEMVQVPTSPEFVQGVINLRGHVIPVVDLRTKLTLPPREEGGRACIIIASIEADGAKKVVGLVVDLVFAVQDISPSQIELSPTVSSQALANFVQAMAKVDDGLAMLLDIDKVLTQNEVASMNGAG